MDRQGEGLSSPPDANADCLTPSARAACPGHAPLSDMPLALPMGPRAALRLARSRPPRPHWPVTPVAPALMAWLAAPGSLTARLMAHGPVTVKRCRQGTARLTAPERKALRATAGHVREVVLSVAGQPAVWARSATRARGLKGPWKAVRGLGTRPLAELLFSHARVLRGPLEQHTWRRGSPEQRRACKDLAALGASQPPRWARASVFAHQGQPLRVMEAFLPHVAGWRP